jgi:hypothetical protein
MRCPRRSHRAPALLLALGLGWAGCEREPASPSPPEPASQSVLVAGARTGSPLPEPVLGSGDDPGADDILAPRIIAAFVPDADFADGEPVLARRLIYRVALGVPPILGERRHVLGRPATELVVDVSDHRLRARFEGPGWPVAPGSEVRIRRDQPGAYAFGSAGGRPLGPGQLAAWFEGGRVRRYPPVRVRAPGQEEQVGPGNLMCRLLAEWANHPTDAFERRCGDGGSPLAFRLGPWRADRTADVAVKLPRAALRADHEGPPDPPEPSAPLLLDAALAARVPPTYAGPDGEPGPHTLRVHNEGRARALVVVGGAAAAWVDAGAHVELEGFRAGIYRLGVMRPLGGLTQRVDRVRIPGELTLPH